MGLKTASSMSMQRSPIHVSFDGTSFASNRQHAPAIFPLRDSSLQLDRSMRRGQMVAMRAQQEPTPPEEERRLPWYFDVGTKGGALAVPTMTTIIPITMYYALQAGGMSWERAGPVASFSYLMLGLLGWTATYLFRVGTKKMTYVQQLKDYEDAVMMKRLEEMSDDEIVEMLKEAEDAAKSFDAQAAVQRQKEIQS
eukprot:CAMPEP_0197517970 /NCGR_PEP_ID=MMETSP1318-20131121/3061_1 /TAXON_ID=552666 /ORGANISM="Partenskyella glossopodia, Strain RCC365" /LENGTH=195 /DNA_ID=CAMNT_0043067949 /DNA_START=126 /DNA_END=713 /DNA_ORIENTATION=+